MMWTKLEGEDSRVKHWVHGIRETEQEETRKIVLSVLVPPQKSCDFITDLSAAFFH